MTHHEFCWWLQGYTQCLDGETPNAKEWNKIIDCLNAVNKQLVVTFPEVAPIFKDGIPPVTCGEDVACGGPNFKDRGNEY